MARKKRPAAQPSRPTMDDDPVVKGLPAISLKRVRPGTKLVADQLVEAFGSNRIHIRQVFEHLGSRNIIRLYPNRGAYVAQPTMEEARQIFATRRILERAAVSDLIDRLDDQSVKALQEHVQREHAHPERDRWNTLTITGDFHSLIARLGGNAVLAKFIDELVLRTSLIIATFEPRNSEDCCALRSPRGRRARRNSRPGGGGGRDGHSSPGDGGSPRFSCFGRRNSGSCLDLCGSRCEPSACSQHRRVIVQCVCCSITLILTLD